MEYHDNPITDYWMAHYLHPKNDMCTLCGQSGIIHTEGIRTPAGAEVGMANYCICPNGQALREQGFLTPRAVDGATHCACGLGLLPDGPCPMHFQYITHRN